jgi:hypothetical protein
VATSTNGLITGAASAKAMPAGSATPLVSRRRVAGIDPHSQTGKARPSSEPPRAARKGLRGESWRTWSALTNRWIADETRTPAIRKGRASMKMPRKTVTKPCSWPVQGASAAGTAMSLAIQIRTARRAARSGGSARRQSGARSGAGDAAARRISSMVLTLSLLYAAG